MRKSFWDELYAGYDYVRVTARSASLNFNGGSGQLAYNANNWPGIVGDFGGYYTGNGFTGGIISYLFGPRINLRGHGKVTLPSQPFYHDLLRCLTGATTCKFRPACYTWKGGLREVRRPRKGARRCQVLQERITGPLGPCMPERGRPSRPAVCWRELGG
jgi:hypothetical protein